MGVQKVKHGLGGTDESLPAANMYSQDDLTKLELQGHWFEKKNQYGLLNMENLIMEKFPVAWYFKIFLNDL